MAEQMIFDIEEDELEIFLEEVNEHLQALETGILQLERNPDPDLVNRVFRGAHTIKALAGTVGHHRMAELTHTMETIFDAMREGVMVPTPAIADELLSATDILTALRDEFITHTKSDVDVESSLTRLRAVKDGEQKVAAVQTEAVAEVVSELDKAQQELVRQFVGKKYSIFKVVAEVDPTGFAPAARLAQAAMAAIEDGEVILQDPTMQDLTQSKHDNKLKIIVATKAQQETLEKSLADVQDLTSSSVTPYEMEKEQAKAKEEAVAQTQAATKRNAANAGGGSEISPDKTVRISVERLDVLMNLVGELVTDRNRLAQIENNLLQQYGKEGSISELGEMTSHLGRVVDQLQEEVMRARMLPVASTFNKMPRIVRDVSRAAGKQVNLVIEGEETELDRSLLEYLGDPLIHLLRNAADHGVETPQARMADGKNPTGTIRLTAAHQEGHIVITIQDDGKGIDPNKVKQAAVRRNLISEEEASQMEDEDAVDLIFRPNLSTAEKVTNVSGRGVGMDVVRSNIERLSGSVVVDSTLGEGTTFKITLPLTLAIVQTMLVSLYETAYAIPLAGIIESLYLSDVDVSTVKGSQVIHWRNSVLPLLDLREFFVHPRHNRNGNKQQGDAKTAVVTVAWGKQRVGLVVDRIVGKQDIVVKSLSPIMGELPGLSGATILGDGKIALIVDIPGLISTALQTRRLVG